MKTNMTVTDTISITHHKGDRYIRDGLVGVVYGPEFGAGFSTWGVPAMATDPKIVELALAMIDSEKAGDHSTFHTLDKELDRYVKVTYDRTYHQQPLTVTWVRPGTRFIIQEYDGAECVVAEEDIKWGVA